MYEKIIFLIKKKFKPITRKRITTIEKWWKIRKAVSKSISWL